MFFGIMNIIFGAVLVSPSFISKELLDKYQKPLSWLGVFILAWGIMAVVSAIFNIFLLFTDSFYWLLWLFGGVVAMCLGAILGRDTLKQYLTPKFAKIEQWISKLIPHQRNIGIAAIVIGAIQLFL